MKIRIHLLSGIAAILILSACQPKETTTEAGYRYISHISNSTATPQPGEFVYFTYQLRNGEEVIQATRDRSEYEVFRMTEGGDPSSKSPVIDALKLMSVGDSLTVFFPLDSMPSRPAGFEDVDVLEYDLVLLNIVDQATYEEDNRKKKLEMQQQVAEFKKEAEAKGEYVASILEDYKSGALNDQIQKTETGLEIVIHEAGDGPKPESGKVVQVHYYGVVKEDGSRFDDSWTRGESFEFTLGRGSVIAGWDEGLSLLSKGSKATLFIPYNLAYGEAGRPPQIPEKADLVFYIEFEDIK